MYATVCSVSMTNQSSITPQSTQPLAFAQEKPEWLSAWKSQEETLCLLRLLRPRLHKTTLARMRRVGKIEATKFAGEWYYKPETAFPKPLR